MAQYNYNGKLYNFPDDVSEDEALAYIDSEHPEEQAQGAAQAAPATQQEQAPQSAGDYALETLKGSGRIAAGAVSDIANMPIGALNALGQGVQAVSNYFTGEQGQYKNIPAAGYGDYDQYLQPQTTGEKIVAAIPSYMVGGEFIAPAKAAANAGRLAKVGTSLARNYMAALPATLGEHNQGVDNQALQDQLIATGAGTVAEGLLHYGGKLYRAVAPEWAGGTSQAAKAADVVTPEAAQRAATGGAYTEATTNQAGESILNPSQTMNPDSSLGRAAIRQEARGANPTAQANTEAQHEAVKTALDNQPPVKDIQDASLDIIKHVRREGSDLYNSALDATQDLLDANRIKTLKFPNTKKVGSDILYQNAERGKKLTPDTLNLIKDFNSKDFTDIKMIDNYKRSLADAARKAKHNNDKEVLYDMVNSLKSELDTTLNRINPKAASVYNTADQNWAQMNADFGEGNPLTDIAKKKTEYHANNVFFGSDTAPGRATSQQNTQATLENLQKWVDQGKLPQSMLDEFKASLGKAANDQAYAKSISKGEFNPQKFSDNLNAYAPQIEMAGNQQVNQPFIDIANTFSTTAKAGKSGAETLGRVAGVGAASVAGHAVGGAGGAAAAMMGSLLIPEVTKGVQTGVTNLVERMARTGKRAKAIQDYIADPANAQKVVDELARRNASVNDVPISELNGIVKYLSSSAGGNASNTSNLEASTVSPEPLQPQGNTTTAPINNGTQNAAQEAAQEPQQHAQAVRLGAKYDKATDLYNAIADAETGGIADPFLRTRAPEGAKPSTAYGTVQLTHGHMKDFVSRHPDIFTKSEKDYIDRFLAQGEKFKKAAKDDPQYGYGAPGDLTSDADRKLYKRVVIKMINQEIQDYGGSMDQTLLKWRGNNKDTGYFQKVVKSYKQAKANKSKQGWGSGESASNIFDEVD